MGKCAAGARAVALLLAALLWSCGAGGDGSSAPPPPPPPGPLQVTLETVTSSVAAPVDLQNAGDGSGRLFIVERRGTIRIFRNGTLEAGFFLDISSRVDTQGEGGLLGLAFHPAFAQNRRFFVHYTTTSSPLRTVISEFRVSATNPNVADPAETVLLTLEQPFSNHNGGQIAFGPDGFLYIALGDGGGAGDPLGNGQRLDTLLGKLLRIDVNRQDPGRNYAIPPDNPFAGQGNARGEIWAYGLRNPWRFSFDRATGRLFLADVGQDRFEEINLIARGGNYGWNVMEGRQCFQPPSGCNTSGLALPIFDYGHSDGESVTGGYVYRGAQIPRLVGVYVFGDFISGVIWGLQQDAQGNWQRTELVRSGRRITSFGVDEQGEMYVADIGGSVLRLREVTTP
ncbi:MAG: PQQ-dependent sugar dehydrogenase [Acidobacteriia bacterium]|nr:PQQ-dependent sugar dehydrogenase [Terriglobia bacterium]